MLRILDRKLDFACLLHFPGFVYLNLRDFFTNWLEPPPGVDSRIWITAFCEMLGLLDMRVATRGMFASKALWLCDKWNSVETGIYPTLHTVYQLIKRIKYPQISNMARHQETIVNRLDGLFAVFGKQVSSQRRLNWPRFMATDWGISLNGIPTDYQNLYITVMIGKILMYRMAMNQRSRVLVDLVVFDEASAMLKKAFERDSTYLLTDYLAQAREFGIGFIIGSQSWSNMADSVLANTAIKALVGGAGLGADYDVFAEAIGMTPEQKEFLKQRTIPGMACARDPRYPHPFTFEVVRVVE